MRDDAQDAVARAVVGLSGWAAGLAWEDLPDDVRRRAALILVDDFAAMVAAREEPELTALRAGIARSAGPAEAAVFDGRGQRLDRYSAALSNGAAADWCELDGGYRPAVCHAALYCLPALMAEAEARAAPLRDLLVALVAGYEAVARFACAFAFPPLVLHPHGGLATIGAAAAVARLRNLDAETSCRAVATAATLVLPGPFRHAVEGALVRNVWPGLCAQNGLRATDWSEMGISGTPGSVADVFVSVLGAKADAAMLVAGLGRDWAMREGYHKIHACCQYGHSTVEAVLAALAGEGTLGPDRITAVRVEVHDKGQALDNAEPATTLAAKFSIQHIAAATAVFGHAGAAAFAAGTLADEGMARLRQRVAIAPFTPRMDWPNDRPARVTLTLNDGRVLLGECRSARGGPDRPFAPEEIISKSEDILGAVYPRAVAPLVAATRLEDTTLARSWRAIVADFA
jgi:2-methylcitrate dehydratase PrpD